MRFTSRDIHPWADGEKLNDALESVMCARDTLKRALELNITCSAGTDKMLRQMSNLTMIESAIYDRLCDLENREEQRSTK